VPSYRIYTIDQHGHIAGPPGVIDAPDDEAARATAKQQLDGHVIELWIGSRRIAKFDPLHK
jgi:hypothetical protein